MDPAIRDILSKVLQVQPILHDAGTVSDDTLLAIAKYAQRSQPIRRSVETGCGATTLLLSHLSEHHTVFALDVGRSIANVRQSPLLRADSVTFVEGPSQLTLPPHRFAEPLQLVVIDGPHAFPFPDLEYYYLYPHLETGALLVLDDIQIRTINNLFQFLRCDEMFQQEEVVGSTAFFRRTSAPTFDPLGDSWGEQKYNARTLLRYGWRPALKSVLPRGILRRLAAHRHQASLRESECFVEILSPHRGQQVPDAGGVGGVATFGDHAYL